MNTLLQEAQTTPNQFVVQTKDLSKQYGKNLALDRATFTITPGCTGLLGPNGAGKSTLIKLLLGLLTPDQGEAMIAGCNVRTQPLELRKLVGYMPEHECLPSDWLAQDFVRYMGELHGLPTRTAIQRASDTLYHVGLGEERYRAIGGFSTGMKQRVKLAQALVHDPQVLLLDEPTNGLDPAGRDEMLSLIGRITHVMGINVILSSHLLIDIERVADSVVILSAGHIIAQGTLRELMQATPAVTVRTRDNAAPLAEALRSRGYGVEADQNELQVEYRSEQVYDDIRDAAIASRAAIVHLKRRILSLEDIYLAGQESTSAQAQQNGLAAGKPGRTR
jgi:ABC-2 type transport system ATP-binding protein